MTRSRGSGSEPAPARSAGARWRWSHFLGSAALGAGVVFLGPLLEAVVPFRYAAEVIALCRFPVAAFACGWWLSRGVPGASIGSGVAIRMFAAPPDDALSMGLAALVPFVMLGFELLGWWGRRVANRTDEP